MKKGKYYLFAVIFIIILFCKNVNGNPIPYYFDHYKSSEGLSNNSIYCSFQDSNGFLWFGTKDGLNRFDGRNFRVFKRSNTNKEGLGSNFIYALAEDKDKNLWVGTDNGIYYTTPNSHKFHLLTSKFKSKGVYDIIIDNNNTACFLSNGQLYSYDINNKILTHIATKFLLTTLSKNHTETIYVGTNNGKLYKLQKNRLILIVDFTKHIETEHKISIQVIRPINSNEILVGTSKNGILKWDNSTKKTTLFFNDNELFVRDILINDSNTYWYATENGLYVHNIKHDTYSHYTKKINEKWGISDNAIYTILKDNQGGIWLGTYFSGLNYYHANNNYIQKVYPTGDPDNLQGSIVRAINQDQSENIWIGTEDGGFSKWDKKENKFYNYSTKTQTIANNNVHGLLIINNTLWISTFFNGIDIFNTINKNIDKHISRTLTTHKELQSNFLNFLFQTKNGNIYATTRGLFKYDKQLDNFVIDKNLPPNIIFTSIFEDSHDNLWISSYRNGLFFYNPHKEEIKQYLKEDKVVNNLPHNGVNYVYEDSNQTIWVATDEGIAYLEKNNDEFISINTSDLQFGNIIYGIIEDEEKNLWISSSYGLLRYNIETKSKRVFNMESGLISMVFNYNSVFKDRSKYLYFGCTEGLISFDPKKLNSIKYPKDIPLFITDFQLQKDENNKSIINDSIHSITIPSTNKITLKYDESSFSISYAALLFQSSRSISYQYTMEGLTDSWINMNNNRKVSFIKLSPGTYTFKVRGKDPDGYDIPSIAYLHITVLNPWYTSPLAVIGYFIILTTILIFIYNYYLQKSRIKNKEEMLLIARQKDQELFQSKMTFFIEVAHEIRTPLTLIKAPLEKLITSVNTTPKEDKLFEIIHRNTEKLIKLSNHLLDFRKTEVAGYRLELSYHNVEKILSKIYQDFNLTIKNLNKKVEYNAESNIITMIDVEAFETICSNLLSNSLKYSDTFIKILLSKNEQNSTFTLQIKNDGDTIEDNEIPHIFEAFKRSHLHKNLDGNGLGLALTKSLTEKHGGHIVYYKDINNLNTFELTFNLIIK